MLKTGDIILVDSDKSYAKVVKFLMQSPTVWHWIIGKIVFLISKKKPSWLIDEVRYYHAAMALNEKDMIEQQGTVLISPLLRLKGKKFIVWRNVNLNPEDVERLKAVSMRDIGKKYDILLIFGKLFSWLTGIGAFAGAVQSYGKEICATRVAYWYAWGIFENFGKSSWHEVTTDDMDDWCASHPSYAKIEVAEGDL